MRPNRAQPLDRGRERGLHRARERGEHVVLPHLLQPPQKVAGVVEHQPRPQAARDEPAHEIRGAAVAPQEHRGVVVVALPRVLQHVLQVRDQRRAGRVAGAEHGRLVHVQRHPEHRPERGRIRAGSSGWADCHGDERCLETSRPASRSNRLY